METMMILRKTKLMMVMVVMVTAQNAAQKTMMILTWFLIILMSGSIYCIIPLKVHEKCHKPHIAGLIGYLDGLDTPDVKSRELGVEAVQCA